MRLSPPARLALMTYHRQDSFVTTARHDTTRTATLGAKRCYIQSATVLHSALLPALAIDGGRNSIFSFFYRTPTIEI